jgi:hypothetical protein
MSALKGTSSPYMTLAAAPRLSANRTINTNKIAMPNAIEVSR